MSQDLVTKTRPTKKQKALLDFIADFIARHGYSPSYREIKTGMNYNSVATVALHINNLVARGHLLKRDNAARSLEPVMASAEPVKSNKITEKEEKWLVKKVEFYFSEVEQVRTPSTDSVDRLYVLVGALKILGLDGAAQSFIARLAEIKRKLDA